MHSEGCMYERMVMLASDQFHLCSISAATLIHDLQDGTGRCFCGVGISWSSRCVPSLVSGVEESHLHIVAA